MAVKARNTIPAVKDRVVVSPYIDFSAGRTAACIFLDNDNDYDIVDVAVVPTIAYSAHATTWQLGDQVGGSFRKTFLSDQAGGTSAVAIGSQISFTSSLLATKLPKGVPLLVSLASNSNTGEGHLVVKLRPRHKQTVWSGVKTQK